MFKISFKSFFALLKQAFSSFFERDPFNNSVIVAYYTIFSLPGLLVIVINVAGYFFGKEAVTNQISTQIGSLVGADTATDIQNIVVSASESKGTVLSTILSVATLLFGATGVFYQVQQILNKIWEVKPKPKQKIIKLIRDRLFSFGLILVVGFLLLVSLVLSAALSAFGTWFSNNITDALPVLFSILDILVSIAVVTLLFAAIFKFLPDIRISWKEVLPGALVTAILFSVAKFALGLYFGKSDPSSAYGAAGTIVLIMLWVSYAGMILFYGAEFTRVYSTRNGKKVKPTESAEFAKAEKKEKERVFSGG
ncbi:MAG TPA: YihY/virulence factor BrkB family protein [Cyclobacteriaceae bacterium]|nr:YihY/virulence factor BrkB family protein [Cyclobacteriaceae bacterium]